MTLQTTLQITFQRRILSPYLRLSPDMPQTVQIVARGDVAPARGWLWPVVRGPLCSLAFHWVVILSIGNWWLASISPKPPVALQMAAVAEPAVELEQLPEVMAPTVELQDSTSTQSTSMEVAVVEVNEIDGELESLLPAARSHQPARAATMEVAELMGQLSAGGEAAGGAGGRPGGGKEDLGPAMPGEGADFFGIHAGGKRFVFVVDCSRSMSGKRWVLACQELLRSVEQLKEDQSFYVIFFDRHTHPMFTKRVQSDLLPATDENRKRLKRWMAGMRFGYDTFPAASMRLALRLNPDAVFLLSDGEFQDNTRSMLRLENRARGENGEEAPAVPIHTIGFHSPAAQASLRPLAAENAGRFRFIPNPRDRHLTRVRP